MDGKWGTNSSKAANTVLTGHVRSTWRDTLGIGPNFPILASDTYLSLPGAWTNLRKGTEGKWDQDKVTGMT